MTSKEQIFNKISKSIHAKDPHAQAFLFGSRARGDNRENSDWDILILVDSNKITNTIEDKFRDDLYGIELEDNLMYQNGGMREFATSSTYS